MRSGRLEELYSDIADVLYKNLFELYEGEEMKSNSDCTCSQNAGSVSCNLTNCGSYCPICNPQYCPCCGRRLYGQPWYPYGPWYPTNPWITWGDSTDGTYTITITSDGNTSSSNYTVRDHTP